MFCLWTAQPEFESRLKRKPFLLLYGLPPPLLTYPEYIPPHRFFFETITTLLPTTTWYNKTQRTASTRPSYRRTPKAVLVQPDHRAPPPHGCMLCNARGTAWSGGLPSTPTPSPRA